MSSYMYIHMYVIGKYFNNTLTFVVHKADKLFPITQVYKVLNCALSMDSVLVQTVIRGVEKT